MSEHEILIQRMVDIQKATGEIREASERIHATSSHKNSSSKHFAPQEHCVGQDERTRNPGTIFD